MTRDIELARKILIAIASSERPFDSNSIRVAGCTPEQINEQIQQLTDAHLLEGFVATGADRRQRWQELRLTWAGFEFLDAARDETIWRTAVAAMHDENGTESFAAWQAMLNQILLEIYRTGNQEP